MKSYLSVGLFFVVFFSPVDSYSASREVGGWRFYIDLCFVLGFQNCFGFRVRVFQRAGRRLFMAF